MDTNSIDTSGGALIEGNVTAGKNFIGRDNISTQTMINNFIDQTLTAIELAQKERNVATQQLAEGIQAYAKRLSELATKRAENYPYKGLLEYRLSDAPFFFGRDQSIREIIGQLKKSKFNVLQSESGAGKSSLLRAGLTPKLLEGGYLPIILRSHNISPTAKLKRELISDLSEVSVWQDISLRGLLKQATSILG